jgi:hypothetical protein
MFVVSDTGRYGVVSARIRSRRERAELKFKDIITHLRGAAKRPLPGR